MGGALTEKTAAVLKAGGVKLRQYSPVSAPASPGDGVFTDRWTAAGWSCIFGRKLLGVSSQLRLEH